MSIEVMDLTDGNLCLRRVLEDTDVFIIKPSIFEHREYEMVPIARCDVKDLLSEDSVVIRIKKEKS